MRVGPDPCSTPPPSPPRVVIQCLDSAIPCLDSAFWILLNCFAQALLHDVAVCAALVGEGDIAELEAQCRRGRLDEADLLTM